MKRPTAWLSVVRKSHPLKDWARRIRKRSSHKKASRGPGAQAGGDPAPDAGHRRSFSMAAEGGCRLDISEHPIKGSANQRTFRPQPGRGPRRSHEFGCKTDSPPPLRLIPWEAEAKGHYDEASGPNAGNDFGDNRVPGKGQEKVQKELDHGTGIRQPGIGGRGYSL